jgi:hypothetical protein
MAAACVYWLGDPRKGSVEYHKRRYLAALTPSLIQPLVDDMPWRIQEPFRNRQTRHIEFHRQALIDAGYLAQKVYIVSNRPPFNVATSLLTTQQMLNTNTDRAAFHVIRYVSSNSITIVGPPGQIHQWDELVRAADVLKD